MISLWIVIGLILSTICVSILAAFFSIVGLAALFSGAWIAVCAMAGSLEFSKFILAAYLHQRWADANKIMRTYMVFAIVILSLITSLGIFGFLSDAYQAASHDMEAETLKADAEKEKVAYYKEEIARLTRSVDEIPDERISKKLKARAAAEPMIVELNKKIEEATKLSADLDLKVLDIKKKVGPLIYISKAFNIDIDTTVKYLIFIFVLVFDPLAICLVIASTQAIDSRKNKKAILAQQKVSIMAEPVPVAVPTTASDMQVPVEPSVQFETTAPEVKASEAADQSQQLELPVAQTVTEIVAAPVVEKKVETSEDLEHMIQMSYSEQQAESEKDSEKNKVG